MPIPLARGMSEAFSLTRSGRLTEASALMRSLIFTQPAPAGGECRPVAAPGPAESHFLSLTHRSTKGHRTYRLYVPASGGGHPMPLVVMLHGCTQSPEAFAAGTDMNVLAEEFACLIAWPAQPRSANLQKCWNWFRPEDQARGRGEPALIAGIVGDVLRGHPADPARVYVAGLSAGGAAAAVMGTVYPDLIAAVGVHSGLPVGGAKSALSALSAMRHGAAGKARGLMLPVIVFHGSADRTVHPGNGGAVIAQTIRARPDLKRVSVDGIADGGRAFTHTRYEDAKGCSMAEYWEIKGAGHAWAGGQAAGSYTDPKGPDASREMLRFFLQHKRA